MRSSSSGPLLPASHGRASTLDVPALDNAFVPTLDTRSFQQLTPLQLPGRLRDRIEKAQRRAAAEKEGVSIFAASTLSHRGDDSGGAPQVIASARDDRRSQKRLSSVGDARASTAPAGVIGPGRGKQHLPDVVLDHKMREFEAKMHVHALFIDPLETSLNRLTIEEKEKVMLKMHEKIREITSQVEQHFTEIKDSLDAKGIFDAEANQARAQALCLVELQRRCRLDKIRDDAVEEVRAAGANGSNRRMGEAEGRLNQLFAQSATQNPLQPAEMESQSNHDEIPARLGRTPTQRYSQASIRPICEPTPNAFEGDRPQLGRRGESSPSDGIAGASADLGAKDDVMSRHPHIAHVLAQLATKVDGMALTESSNDPNGAWSELMAADEGSNMTPLEEWQNRPPAYQLIASKSWQELFRRSERWRWDSLSHFAIKSECPAAISDSIRKRLGPALVHNPSSTADIMSSETASTQENKLDDEYHRLQSQIQARRQEPHKTLARPSSMVLRFRAISGDQTAKAQDDQPEAGEESSSPSSVSNTSRRESLGSSISAPILAPQYPQDAFDPSQRPESRQQQRHRTAQQVVLDRRLPRFLNPAHAQSTRPKTTLIGATTPTDVLTLGQHINARMEQRRNTAQTWTWYSQQDKLALGTLEGEAEADDDDEEEDSQGSDTDGDGEQDEDADATKGCEQATEHHSSVVDNETAAMSEIDDTQSIRSSESSRLVLDSARSSMSYVSTISSMSKTGKSGKRAHHGARGRLTHRSSRNAPVHFSANAQILQQRLESLWRVLEFPFSSKLLMLEKYAALQSGEALENALAPWEAAAELVVLREKMKDVLAEYEDRKDVNVSARMSPTDWVTLGALNMVIPRGDPAASSPQALVQWIQQHMDEVTQHCEKRAQQLKAQTGDELLFQGLHYPPRV